MSRDRFKRQAIKEAERVSYKWRLGAVLTRQGRLLASGRVRYRHDSAIHCDRATWHAEEVAIRSALFRLPKGS